MQRKKINIAVTGLNAIDSPGPGISVIRALRESKIFEVRIIGLAYETMEPGIYMHELVDKTYQLPLPSAGTETLLKRLQYIHAIEKLQVIIPNFDSELFNFIRISEVLKNSMNICMFLPTAEQFEARSKANLEAFGKKNNVLIPKSKTINHPAELNSDNDLSYPMVIKGKFYDALVVHSFGQAVDAFNKISSKWGLPIIVQEFIQGQEVNVTVLGDGKGNTIGAVPMRKQYITDKGKAWSGISISDEKLLELTNNLVHSTKWRGAMELEIIRTDNEDYYLLEINPRFPAWVFLAVGCGQNHPEALVRMAIGEELKPYERYDVGKLFIRYSYDMIVNLAEFEKISTVGEL
ncbi:MAG: ATP-grasp domain-containing protein [Bacteroidota bacterium]